MSDSAILTEHLTKRYGTHTAVDDLCIAVQRGTVFGLLGPNGAGKTTTISLLLALTKPTSGRALIFGHDVQREPEQALRHVGAMVETPAFYPYLSARDNLRVLARASGLGERRADAVLAIVELEQRAKDQFKTFSQGMKQRLGIAAALLHDPQLIILDEPTNGLDPAGQQEIRVLIQQLATEGRTVLLCSHLLHDVEQLCHEIVILRGGRVVVQGSVAELLQRGRGVFVRVVGDVARAELLLRGIAWIDGVEQRGDGLHVDAPIERAAEINALLARQGVAVAEVRADTGRLEDVFLEVTRQETRDTRRQPEDQTF